MRKNKDYRFSIANREALMAVGLAIINFIWWFSFAYGMGKPSPENYTYILGFPAWFFYSCIIGFLLMIILVVVVVKFFLTDVPLDEEGGHQE